MIKSDDGRDGFGKGKDTTMAATKGEEPRDNEEKEVNSRKEQNETVVNDTTTSFITHGQTDILTFSHEYDSQRDMTHFVVRQRPPKAYFYDPPQLCLLLTP
jgi:hypothetical protein